MNPELRRNLWQEFSIHRLIAMPAIIAIVVSLIASTSRDSGYAAISIVSIIGFVAVTMAWGTRLAINSISDEISGRTWDWQRLSALRPWTMTWGKLFGSTAFSWYGGILFLVVFLSSAAELSFGSPWKISLALMFFAVFLHAGSMAWTLHSTRQDTPSRNRISGLLFIFVLLNMLYGLFAALGKAEKPIRIDWFGNSYSTVDFILWSSGAFAAWACVGAYRTMCQGLMVRTTPWLWLVFLAFLSVYSGGFISDPLTSVFRGSLAIVLCGFGWALLLTYIMLFSEQSTPSAIRRIMLAIQAGRWRRAAEEIPNWVTSWMFMFGSALLLGLLLDDLPFFQRASRALPLAVAMLVLRDAGILLYFMASPKSRRAVPTALIYTFVLSGLLPMLLTSASARPIAELLMPLISNNSLILIVSPVVQAAIALYVAWQRISRQFPAK